MPKLFANIGKNILSESTSVLAEIVDSINNKNNLKQNSNLNFNSILKNPIYFTQNIIDFYEERKRKYAIKSYIKPSMISVYNSFFDSIGVNITDNKKNLIDYYNNSENKFILIKEDELKRKHLIDYYYDIESKYKVENFNDNYIISIYDKKYSSNYFSSGPLKEYYNKKFKYSFISDFVLFLIGQKSTTNIFQNIISGMYPVAEQFRLGGLLNIINNSLNIPFIRNTINSNLVVSGIWDEGTIKWQHLPSLIFYETNKNKNIDSNNTLEIIKQASRSAILSAISNIGNRGYLNRIDLNNFFDVGYNIAEIMMLSSRGIKYTRATGWFDPTKPQWSNESGYITWDKYVAYDSENTSYLKQLENNKNTLLQKYKDYFNIDNQNSLFNNKNLKSNIEENYIKLKLTQYKIGFGDFNNELFFNLNNNTNNINNKNNNISLNNKNNYDLIYGIPTYNIFEASKFVENGNSSSLNLYIADHINMTEPYIETNNSSTENNLNLEDLINFRFEDISLNINNPIVLLFRATLTNINDNINANWNEHKYLGRPDIFYTYNGFSREISFDFKVYCNSNFEVKSQWKKLNYLVGLCYPNSYINNIGMKAPIIRLTIGDMYQKIYGHIKSLTINPTDSTFWSISKKKTDDKEIEYFDLPISVDVKVSFGVMMENYNFGAPITEMKHFAQESKLLNL